MVSHKYTNVRHVLSFTIYFQIFNTYNQLSRTIISNHEPSELLYQLRSPSTYRHNTIKFPFLFTSLWYVQPPIIP